MKCNSGSFHSLLLLLVAEIFQVSATSTPEMAISKENHLLSRSAPPATKHLSDKVHGILMGITVILIFPFGSICWRLLDRVVSGTTLFKIHICCQLLGLAMLVAGFGVGVWVCVIHNEVRAEICIDRSISYNRREGNRSMFQDPTSVD
jgi:hypothetical protein